MKTTEWINGRSALAVLMGALMLPAWAAESAPPAARPVVAEDEHAGHAAHEAAGTEGAARPSSWTAFPLLKTKMSGESRERRVIMVIPQGMTANRIDAYSNNLKDAQAQRELALEMAGAKLGKLESGGFHWLAAREEQEGQVRVASTVHYSSERGAQNPTAMFMRPKHELEIIPRPYPREHSRYRSNEEWQFLVHFNGAPLANHKLFMETANGSRVELMSDAQGVVTARIPDDFGSAEQVKKPGVHDHGRRGSDFVLATEHAEGGKTYLTAFNAGYGPDAFEQRSLAMGLGFTLLGMIGAVPLLRHRKAAKAETAKNEEI
jgi:hypothetical protein